MVRPVDHDTTTNCLKLFVNNMATALPLSYERKYKNGAASRTRTYDGYCYITRLKILSNRYSGHDCINYFIVFLLVSV